MSHARDFKSEFSQFKCQFNLRSQSLWFSSRCCSPYCQRLDCGTSGLVSGIPCSSYIQKHTLVTIELMCPPRIKSSSTARPLQLAHPAAFGSQFSNAQALYITYKARVVRALVFRLEELNSSGASSKIRRGLHCRAGVRLSLWTGHSSSSRYRATLTSVCG